MKNGVPLSPQQYSIWKLQHNSCQRTRFNIPVTVRLVGLVESSVLAAAIRDVVKRHHILRTIFMDNKGTPCQKVLDMSSAGELEIHHIKERNMEMDFNEAVCYGFDLRCETPLRAHLFSFNPALHTLLMVFHRIAFDCDSIQPLIRDLFHYYSARMESRKPALAKMPMQYADYAAIQSRWSENESVSEKSKRPQEGQSYELEKKGMVPIRINPSVHQMLLDFANSACVSVASILHSAFAVLCARLNLTHKVIVNVIGSVRNSLPDASAMIGNFETNLSLGIDTHGNPTFREVVGHAAQSYSVACKSQNRSCNYTNSGAECAGTQFRTMFRLKAAGVEAFEFSMLKVYVNPAPMMETGFELVFDFMERRDMNGIAQGIEGSVIFDRNVFAPRYMPIRIDWMMNLLKHGIQYPNVHMNELSIEEKQTTWARAVIAPESPACSPQRGVLARIATVYDIGRHDRVLLTNSASSAMTGAPWWQQSYAAYQDALQCRMAGIWEETLNVFRIGVHDRFVDLGGDAAKARRIIGKINKVFRKNLPASLMCGGITIEALANAIIKELPFESVSIIQPEGKDTKPPLFFVHGDVFGGGLYTAELARHLGGDQPFVNFNPHGLDGQGVLNSIEEMAADYLKILWRMRPTGLFWLGGFCNGALIAYEMARMLEYDGQRLATPVLLVEAPPGDISEVPVAEQEPRPARKSAAPPGSQMQKAWVLNELFQLSARYRPGKYAGPVIMVQPEKSLSDRVLVQSVWKKVADNLSVYITPGDHITCIGRHVSELSDIMRGVMESYIPS